MRVTPDSRYTMSLVQTEDFIINATKQALGSRVRGVQGVPGDWDDEMLKRFANFVPGAYVAFAGGSRITASGEPEARIAGRWSVMVCTAHASGESARRRGDALQPGCYELMTVLVPALHGLVVPGVGALDLLDVVNLFTGTVLNQGLAVYALVFALPMTFELPPVDEGTTNLDRVWVHLDVPPLTPGLHSNWLAGDNSAGAPDAQDHIELAR
jgi:phage gp37-like protein